MLYSQLEEIILRYICVIHVKRNKRTPMQIPHIYQYTILKLNVLCATNKGSFVYSATEAASVSLGFLGSLGSRQRAFSFLALSPSSG